MSDTAEILFIYLHDIFSVSPDSRLDLEKLEDDYVQLGKGLMYFSLCFSQYNEFANALAKGDLSSLPPPPENMFAAPLKSLHANLKHLTWQSKQVAKGDYNQKVDFMGEFAEAFNTMVEQLADRQQKLEYEIKLSRKHVEALKQGNKLLSNVTQHIPQPIFVISEDSHKILLMNDMAEREMISDRKFLDTVIKSLPKHKGKKERCNVEISYNYNNSERYLSVNSYHIEWEAMNAIALVINDITAEKKQIKELENHAYYDSMTRVYNRFYGMLTLNEWLDKKKLFTLIFIDMDRLKYINDKFGHGDGDIYIINVAKHLSNFSQDVKVCRIGGDEFMLLIPNISGEQAHNRMEEIQAAIQNEEYLKGKSYTYSVSYGIVAAEENNELSPSYILSIADERMYENKRAKKISRTHATATLNKSQQSSPSKPCPKTANCTPNRQKRSP